MASKKDRKVLRRDGVPSSGSDVHKLAELEACQRLLEMGCVGPRLYKGPHISGSFFTFQDRLLDEVKWTAVDVFEQKKLAIAHCRLISSNIQKYWLEKSRGCLEGAAGMVQAYWQSVASEVHDPGQCLATGVFKLGALQGVGPLNSTFSSTSPSMVPTPSEEDLPKPPLKSQVLDWLDARSALNPPTAETSTTMAEYCVQVVKYQSRNKKLAGKSNQISTPIVTESVFDFHIPVDFFLQGSSDASGAQCRAIEGAVQSSLAATRGVHCAQTQSVGDFRLRPPHLDPESQRSVLVEMLATNVMSRNPQLFRLAVVSSSGADPNAHAKHKNHRRVAQESPMNPSKHYFVSVIFSSFRPLPWTVEEDQVLLALVTTTPTNWALVASQMPTFRTGLQCHDRFLEIHQNKSTKKPKSGFQPVVLLPRKEVVRVRKLAPKASHSSPETVVLPQENLLPEVVLPFERRGLTHRQRDTKSIVIQNIGSKPSFSRVGSSPTKKSEKSIGVKNNTVSPISPKKENLKWIADLARPHREVPRPAFALEEMLRKNPSAASTLTPQYLSGELVCGKHPSFGNIGRIAEITLTRLVNSIEEGVTVAGPLSVKELFGYCAKFRLKYPAIFTSHQTPQKPFMPPLRQSAPTSGSSKMLTRAMTHNEPPAQVPQPPPPVPQSPLPAKKESSESMDSLVASGPGGPGWILPRRSRGAREP